MKKIWILNHYATSMYFRKGGRHHSMARFLKEKGYSPLIFASSVGHNKSFKIESFKGISIDKSSEDIPYVFVKTPEYSGNGLSRIKNMFIYYKNVKKIMKRKIKEGNIPNVIYASSVHPLTLLGGIEIGKKYKIPVICEVRDLWPASIVAYSRFTEKNLVIKLLYKLEKYIYKKADKLIFTMEGGEDYIIEKNWHEKGINPIDLNKVYHINNGVDYEQFLYNQSNYPLEDKNLNSDKFKVIYTGTIRIVNNVQKIIETAEIIQQKDKDVVFIIYGEGTERKNIEDYVNRKKISNVVFKGSVEKKYIPFVLSCSNINIFTFQHNEIKKYGSSMNKMFDYFASGKPTLTDCKFGYDLFERYEAGVAVDNATPEMLAEEIIKIKNMESEDYKKMCDNSVRAAKDYDYRNLTDQLIKIFEEFS